MSGPNVSTSFMPEVLHKEYGWWGNGMRFATEQEALACAIAGERETAFSRGHRVVASTLPANARWREGQAEVDGRPDE